MCLISISNKAWNNTAKKYCKICYIVLLAKGSLHISRRQKSVYPDAWGIYKKTKKHDVFFWQTKIRHNCPSHILLLYVQIQQSLFLDAALESRSSFLQFHSFHLDFHKPVHLVLYVCMYIVFKKIMYLHFKLF